MSGMWCDGRIVAWAAGVVCAVVIVSSKKVREGGIRPQTTRALTICLGLPFLLTLAVQKVFTGETVAGS